HRFCAPKRRLEIALFLRPVGRVGHFIRVTLPVHILHTCKSLATILKVTKHTSVLLFYSNEFMSATPCACWQCCLVCRFYTLADSYSSQYSSLLILITNGSRMV